MTGRGPWTNGAPLHLCPFPGCPEKIHRYLCKGHWYAVAKPARDQIWRAWDSGRAEVPHRLTVLAIVSAASTFLAAS